MPEESDLIKVIQSAEKVICFFVEKYCSDKFCSECPLHDPCAEFGDFTNNYREHVCAAGLAPENGASCMEALEHGMCEQECSHSVPVYTVSYGEISGLPEPEDGVAYIVSALLLAATKEAGRKDCVAPASGHPDVLRNEKGHIVPGFVR